ncbi:MAG: tetratricopeptide repeat protein, partial [Minisyncoccota bacterium]
FLLRDQVLGSEGIHMSLMQAMQSIYNNFLAVFLYIGKIFFPFDLSGLPILQDSSFFYGVIATAIFLILIFWGRRELRWSNFFFGFFWFLIFLIPSFIRPNQQMVADFLEHRVYLPLIGFIIMFLETYFSVEKKISSRGRYLWGGLFVLIIIIFAVINIFHSRIFLDKISFWENAADNSPHAPLAHRNLGAMYWLEGQMDKAQKEYKESLLLNSSEPMAHNNLGLIYASKGDFENAIKEYEAELELNPGYGNALYNLGFTYWTMGRKEDAVEKWKETIKFNPGYLDAYKVLIAYYQDNKQDDLAQKLLLELQKQGGL